jgi:DNA-binding CsgD family transcriptional regulator
LLGLRGGLDPNGLKPHTYQVRHERLRGPMRKSTVDAEQLLKVSVRLGDAAIDPAIWPDIMEKISAAAGASGAVLLQTDARTAHVPRTAGIEEMITNYFSAGWHLRDLRAERGVPLLLRGKKVVTDEDIVTPEETRHSQYYAEAVVPFGFQWFAALGFTAGPVLWAMVLQRTPRQGPFDGNDKRVLATIVQRLTETATLSRAVGKAVLSSTTNAFGLVKQPALVLDRMGFVLDVNSAADQVFDDDIHIRGRRLIVRDQQSKYAVDKMIDQLRMTPDTAALTVDPIVIPRRTKRPLLIRILPIDGAARSPFLDARALLVLSDLQVKSGPQPELLSRIFGLSRSEAKLAAVIAAGYSPQEAAARLGIARETARNQLKAVFAKTGTHRQGELIALLSAL